MIEVVPTFPGSKPRKPRVFKKAPVRPQNVPGATFVAKTRYRLTKTGKRAKGGRTLSKYKKDFDAIFSKYIRAKYPPFCYTCGKGGMMQNGHFIVRSYLYTRWEEDNCRPQCMGCNIYGKGRSVDFEEHLIKDLGTARVQEMKESRKILMRPDEEFYLRNIALYTEKLKNLENPSE